MTETLITSAKLPGGPSTRSVHAGSRRIKANHALEDPIYQTSTFTFDSMADAQAYQTDHMLGQPTDRFEYGRYGNPTIAAAEMRLAALEAADGAILVSSGMAAITQTLLHFLPQGSHVVMTDDSYRRTRQFCEIVLKRYGVACSVVPLNDFAALEGSIRPETRVIFSETPSNPYLAILDLAKFAEIARRHRLVSVVDATFSTPINTRPLDWGIDLVIHSATKYLGGHNDLLAGFIAGREELIVPLRNTIGLLGSISDPNTAYLLLRGMKTLGLRVAQQNANAQRVAEFLVSHPAVETVWYAGLPTHPGHDLAVRQMKGFGGVVSFTVRGDLQVTTLFIDALRTFYISPSLGGIESLILHPASMAYPDCSPEERLEVKMTDNLVRLAIGIEDADDLIADLDQGLRACMR